MQVTWKLPTRWPCFSNQPSSFFSQLHLWPTFLPIFGLAVVVWSKVISILWTWGLSLKHCDVSTVTVFVNPKDYIFDFPLQSILLIILYYGVIKYYVNQYNSSNVIIKSLFNTFTSSTSCSPCNELWVIKSVKPLNSLCGWGSTIRYSGYSWT